MSSPTLRIDTSAAPQLPTIPERSADTPRSPCAFPLQILSPPSRREVPNSGRLITPVSFGTPSPAPSPLSGGTPGISEEVRSINTQFQADLLSMQRERDARGCGSDTEEDLPSPSPVATEREEMRDALREIAARRGPAAPKPPVMKEFLLADVSIESIEPKTDSTEVLHEALAAIRAKQISRPSR